MSTLIDRNDYLKLYKQQDRKCLVCNVEIFTKELDGEKFIFDPNNPLNVVKRAIVEHCHFCGVVRGLVCSRCNTVISYVEKGKESKWISEEMKEIIYLYLANCNCF